MDGTWEIRIDHDHQVCPEAKHSCKRCRRGLACNPCNTNLLAARRTGLWFLPEKAEDIDNWLRFLGPENRDKLRKALTLFPEQPVRRVSQRRSRGEDAPGEAMGTLFDLDAYRPPA